MGEHLILLNKDPCAASPGRAFRWENFLPKLQYDKAKKKKKKHSKNSTQGELDFIFPPYPWRKHVFGRGLWQSLIPILMQMSQSAFDPLLIAQ